MDKGWIGVDFDGTLATYDSGQYPQLGKPIPKMVERVKRWIAEGTEVRIMTARAAEPFQQLRVQDWCWEHFGQKLRVTDRKDYDMLELWDDRAVQVVKNTGERADGLDS